MSQRRKEIKYELESPEGRTSVPNSYMQSKTKLNDPEAELHPVFFRFKTARDVWLFNFSFPVITPLNILSNVYKTKFPHRKQRHTTKVFRPRTLPRCLTYPHFSRSENGGAPQRESSAALTPSRPPSCRHWADCYKNPGPGQSTGQHKPAAAAAQQPCFSECVRWGELSSNGEHPPLLVGLRLTSKTSPIMALRVTRGTENMSKHQACSTDCLRFVSKFL